MLGYRLNVAAVEDVFQGELWAYQDESRRPSKRQKDLATETGLIVRATERMLGQRGQE